MEEHLQLKQDCNTLGGALLIYRVIMNVIVVLVSMAAALLAAVGAMLQDWAQADEDMLLDFADRVAEAAVNSTGWAYLAVVAVGLLILLLWKKPAWYRQIMTQRDKPMKGRNLCIILIYSVTIQLVLQLLVSAVEMLLNLFDLSLLPVLESASAGTNDLGMLLYIGFAAPIAEEILFRGLVMRTLERYGKGFAICLSAILFAFFHGSPVQTPFALLMGLLLGYVAMEYSILWAIAVHFFNNMILGNVLPALLSLLPYELPDLAMWVFYLLCGVLAAGITWRMRAKVPDTMKKLDSENWQWRQVLRSPCIIILVLMCLGDLFLMALTLIVL